MDNFCMGLSQIIQFLCILFGVFTDSQQIQFLWPWETCAMSGV